MRRLLRWYLKMRVGYVAPSGGHVRCTKNGSVLYGTVVQDHGGYIQIMAEGRTLVTLPRPSWTVEYLP